MHNIVCPISTESIDNRTERLGATLTAGLLLAYVGTGLWPILALVVADYALRVFGSRRAPLTWVAHHIARSLGLAARPINKGPKLFAWRLGLLMAANALILVPLNPGLSLGVAAVLAGLSLADGVLNLCVGCLIYSHLVRPLFGRTQGSALPARDAG